MYSSYQMGRSRPGSASGLAGGGRMMMGSSSSPSLQMAGGMGSMAMDAYADPRHQAMMMHSKLDALEHEVHKVRMHQANQQLMSMGGPIAPLGMGMGMGPAPAPMQMQPMSMGSAADQLPTPGRRAAHKELMSAHKELVEMMKMQSQQHAALMKKTNKGGANGGKKKEAEPSSWRCQVGLQL